jgi:hypothetical protein
MPAPPAVANPEEGTPDAKAPDRQGPAWVVRRVLADFTEATVAPATVPAFNGTIQAVVAGAVPALSVLPGFHGQ